MKYKDMNDWLFEVEGFNTRIDRMYEDLDLKDCDDIGKYAKVLKWLEAAFLAGRMTCQRPIKYSANYDAYYYDDTKEWVDSKCLDPDCEYCGRRPFKCLE